MAGERILVVDDEPGVRSALEAILGDEGFRVDCAETGEQGLEALERQTYDAVLLDVWLPGIDGLDTLTELRERNLDTEVVMISGHGTIETAVRATKLGAFDFVEKPLSLEKTLLVLRNALRQRRLEQANRRLVQQLVRDTEILGQSAGAGQLRRDVEIALRSDAPILICGRLGSGRENVARRIHTLGRQAESAFVEIPCGSWDAAGAEGALLGSAEEPGRLELARGGTLFLEDIDRLDPQAQRRLAAALSARGKQPGAPRVISSAAPEAAGIDPELLQVLDVIRIRVPAMRERREDIPLLTERFMRELSTEYGRAARKLAPDSLAALQAYDWPGEMRELRNLVERLLLFAPQDVVSATDLPEPLGDSRAVTEDLYRSFASLAEGVEAFESYFIQRVLAEEGQDQAAAARRLGISAAALMRKIKAT